MTTLQTIKALAIRVGIIGLPIVIIFTVWCFIEIDKTVEHRLSLHNHGSFSVVYSRPARFNAGERVEKEALVKRLKRRNYKAAKSSPGRPGAYTCDSESCTIKLKQLKGEQNYSNPAQVTIRFKDGKITDTSGNLVDAFELEPVILSALGQGEVRAVTRLNLDQIPKTVVQALLSTEDQRFYSHWGIDPIGIGRAVVKNILSGGWVEGGSTITQQLAKNLLFSPRKTLTRKLKEFMAALSLEWRLSKEQILTLYLNEVYFSQEGSVAVHGVEEASRTFFGKSAEFISLEQAALLVGLIKAPSYYSPRRHPERAKGRRNVVLDNMLAQDFITPEQASKAKATPLKLEPSKYKSRKSPFFMAHLEQELQRTFKIDVNPRAGLQVNTFIDEEYQACAEKSVASTLKDLEKRYPRIAKNQDKPLQQGLVAVDTRTGAILAWVGGRDYRKNQFDHVIQAKRQIGSTIKPFLYLTAMDPALNDYKVATTVSVLGDEPTGITLLNQKTWRPENFDHKYRGEVSLRYALEKSLNIPAVYVAQRVGVERIKRTLEQFNVSDEVLAVPALALGAVETSLLELTSAFAALAQLGEYTEPRLFDNVVDPDGNFLASLPQLTTTVNDPGPVFLVVDMMRGVVLRGTGRAARSAGFNYPAAGKTGTSDSARDAWFVGFTPTIAAGVWSGFDDNRKTGLTGGGASAPTWGKFMKCIEPFIQRTNFKPPPTVRMVTLDKRTRKRFFMDCAPDKEFQMNEIFLRGTEPGFSCYGAPQQSDYRRQADEPERPPRRRNSQSFWDTIFDW